VKIQNGLEALVKIKEKIRVNAQMELAYNYDGITLDKWYRHSRSYIKILKNTTTFTINTGACKLPLVSERFQASIKQGLKWAQSTLS
jgi:hypothetical protein